MSYTTLYKVCQDGCVIEHSRYRNSHQAAMLVWDNMARKYLGQPASKYMLDQQMQCVWNLWKNPDVHESERILMAATFDQVMVKRENFQRLIDAIRECGCLFAGHFYQQVRAVVSFRDDNDCIAICWQQTSVARPAWQVYGDDDEEEGRQYNIFEDEGHWFLFGELPKVNHNDH